MPHHIIVPVIRRADYDVAFEQFDNMTLVHVRVRHWSHIVARKMLEEWNVIREMHGGPFFAMNTDDPVQPKFLRLFGFNAVGTATEEGGKLRTLYRKD